MGQVSPDGAREGHGTQTWRDGHVFSGEFKKDQREGRGRMTGSDGEYYGDWSANCRHGQGCMTWPDGKKYDGQWTMDRVNGTGRYEWADGNYFVGEMKDGIRDGTGAMHWVKGGDG